MVATIRANDVLSLENSDKQHSLDRDMREKREINERSLQLKLKLLNGVHTRMQWIGLVLLLPVFIVETYAAPVVTNADLIAVYSSGYNEIKVRNVITRDLIKIFNIQVKYVSGGLAVDYKNDIILFADDRRIFKIYLVDKNGIRKLSGKGELFTGKDNDHFEVLLWSVARRSKIIDLSFDAASGNFYYLYQGALKITICAINPDNGQQSESSFVKTNFKPTGNFIRYRGTYYLSYLQQGISLLRKSIAQCVYPQCANYAPDFERLIGGGDVIAVSSFTIDRVTERLFFTQGSSLRVLDAKVSDYRNGASDAMKKVQIVIADSSLTKGIEGIAVHGNVAIWSSPPLKKMYIGEISNGTNFIHKEDVAQFDNVTPRYIVILKPTTASMRTQGDVTNSDGLQNTSDLTAT